MSTLAFTVSDSATMLRRNLRRLRRYPSMTLLLVGMPIVFLLLFVYVFGGQLSHGLGAAYLGGHSGRAGYLNYVTPGILLVTVAAAVQGTAIVVAMDMTGGIIDRFRTMAIARSAVLTGHVLASLIQSLLSIGVVLGVAVALGFRPEAGVLEWLASIGVLLLFAFALIWLATALGLAAKSVETASNTPMFLTLLPFLGSGFVLTASMPPGLRQFAEYQPFTPATETLRGLLTGTSIGSNAVITVAWSVGIALASYLWARHLYAHRRAARRRRQAPRAARSERAAASLARAICARIRAVAGSENVERRTVRAAEDALAERRAVCALDVLLGLGWLAPSHVDLWRQGRLESLEAAMDVAPAKLSAALASLAHWAGTRGLVADEVEYVARTLDRRALRFSASGDPELERAYQRHWLSPALSPAKREQLVRRERRPPELVVIEPLKEWTCASCGGSGGMLIMEAPGPLCLDCVELGHLVFLAAGDPALTRRARSSSGLAAVVVRFSRTRKRYERQGILVEREALERAERECLSDEQARERRRARDAERRERQDRGLRERFAAEIARLFPGCPPSRAATIAAHAAERGSGRVGRSAAGRALDAGAVELAVVAAIRHGETDYDSLLMRGVDRLEARDRVRPTVEPTLERWRTPPPSDP